MYVFLNKGKNKKSLEHNFVCDDKANEKRVEWMRLTCGVGVTLTFCMWEKWIMNMNNFICSNKITEKDILL